MEIHPIDPRRDPRWETPPTRDYRVIFWRQPRAPEGVAQVRVLWEADENDVVGAQDVHDVIEWAESEARRRNSVYAIYAKVDSRPGPGLVWLAGIDPTVHSRPNFDRQHPADLAPVYD